MPGAAESQTETDIDEGFSVLRAGTSSPLDTIQVFINEKEFEMSRSNQEIVEELLKGATDEKVVERLMAEKSTYMSLTFDNPELKELMPWAGVHTDGREGVLYTFRTLNTFWTIDDFTIKDIFESGENVAVFGSFTVHSKNLDKIFISPFSVHAKVKDGQITYLQYMEDTFGTGATFRSKGVWTFAGDPNGTEVQVGS